MVKNYDIEKDETNISDDHVENVKAVSGSLDKVQRILKDIKKKNTFKDAEGKTIDVNSAVNTAQADISSVKSDIAVLKSGVASINSESVLWEKRELNLGSGTLKILTPARVYWDEFSFYNLTVGTYKYTFNFTIEDKPMKDDNSETLDSTDMIFQWKKFKSDDSGEAYVHSARNTRIHNQEAALKTYTDGPLTESLLEPVTWGINQSMERLKYQLSGSFLFEIDSAYSSGSIRFNQWNASNTYWGSEYDDSSDQYIRMDNTNQACYVILEKLPNHTIITDNRWDAP